MRRLLVTMLLVLAAACGGGASVLVDGTAAPPTTESAGVPATVVAAPDFSLAVHGGGEYVLSEEAKPVYMIFWAEW